jgi:hypothetical protein
MRPTEDRLHPDEPFFTLRGQDIVAPYAVQAYAALVRSAAAGANLTSGPESAAWLRAHADEADRIAAEMIGWQATHPEYAKLPD